MRSSWTCVLVSGVFVLAVVGSSSADTSIITFSDGAEGMVGPSGPGGATTIELSGGNPGANMHTVFNNFGIEFRNNSNAAFVGDYTAGATVTLSIDVRVEDISFFGSPTSRPWTLDLRDYDDPEPGFPYTSVWFKFADISAGAHGSWTTFSVTIDDTSSAELPSGWGGTGAEDPHTAEPTLPPDRTFADVLAGIDEIAFTTLEPGFVFGFTDFDLRIDNVTITTPGMIVPAASDWGMMVLTLLVATAGTLVWTRV